MNAKRSASLDPYIEEARMGEAIRKSPDERALVQKKEKRNPPDVVTENLCHWCWHDTVRSVSVERLDAVILLYM